MASFQVDSVDRFVKEEYLPVKKIGRGLHGILWEGKSVNHQFLTDVAIKRIFNAFSNREDAKRTYREVLYSLKFSEHPNIISVHDVFASENDMDVYLVMDKIDTDLSSVISSMTKRNKLDSYFFLGGLQRIHVEFITWQALRALKYIHSAGVMHRDIKPQNILINANCDIRICDFGLARSAANVVGRDRSEVSTSLQNAACMTSYCSSRWYRSPEQLLLARKYTTSVDIWALGCVVGEMLQRKPIFPSTSTLGQIQNILHITGRPPDADLECIDSKYSVPLLEGLGNSKEGSIPELVPGGNPEAHDFLRLCLQFNPLKRMKAEDALEHPFVGHFHHPDAEPVHPSSVEGGIALPLVDDSPFVQFTVNQYRDELYAKTIKRGRRRHEISQPKKFNLHRGARLSS